MSAPVDPNHFLVNPDGSLTPQSWMQYRCVASVSAPSTAGSYAVTTSGDSTLSALVPDLGTIFDEGSNLANEAEGVITANLGTELLGGSGGPVPATVAGGVKNDLLYSLSASWTNETPIDQWVYGLITRGGVRMTVQARTQAYILVLSGFAVSPNEMPAVPTLTLSSAVGCGANIGLGGVLSIGTAYCIIEERQNGTTFPVQPEICGWTLLEPNQTYTAALQIRYASPYWETSSIDGGTVDTDTSYDDGGSRLDIFALPVLPSLTEGVPLIVSPPAAVATATMLVPTVRVGGSAVTVFAPTPARAAVQMESPTTAVGEDVATVFEPTVTVKARMWTPTIHLT
jgi:hypothetical protein